MLLDYADRELEEAKKPVIGPLNIGVKRISERKRFKYVDGIQRLADMELPFLVDLPNGSCEAVFATAAKNSACGLVPITEYVRGKQTIVDKFGGNGVFLASHDPTMEALLYKTTESVPEFVNNVVFWQIFVNLEDSLD